MSEGLDDVVRAYPDESWAEGGPTHDVEEVVESGHVLAFANLRFALTADESRFLDPRWADGKAKNISLRGVGNELRGAAGDAEDLAALRFMIVRFAAQSEALVLRLFPRYRGRLRRGNTSFRPLAVGGRASSWRQDDSRLHVDAFPSNPMQGTRLLRVFSNVNPNGEPRRWVVGEPFEAHARRYRRHLAPPLPGVPWLLQRLGITKSRRTAYDHAMLQLHDHAKADPVFQKDSPQRRVDFAPGTTWVCFSDQVLHAALGGQHLLEQTFYLGPGDLAHPETAPLATLERLLGRPLLV
ncbi:MAG: Kdo hydroxylase family protein [Pseudomonadota bacterium]|nr:Kdo hydroxylase family protein [Pseudomonadota bacterium]